MSESLGGLSPLGGTTKAPSLFSGGTAKSERQPERISILSSLDKGGVSRKASGASRRRGLFVVAGLLLICAVALALVLAPQEDAMDEMTEAPAPVRMAAEPISPPVVTGGVSQAATIENVSLAALADNSAPEGIPATLSASESGAEVVHTESASPSQSVAAGTRTVASPAATDGAAKRTASRPADKGKTTTAPDGDAALLAALMAHETGVPLAGKSKPANGNSAFDPKRDVVEDDRSLSTAELVRRCETLGLVEGFLCKMRVCANRQGDDPACPQPSSPTAKGG